MLKKLLLALGLSSVLTANANIVIIGTRIIYPAEQKSVNIQLQNTSDKPSLVQAWVDEGDSNSNARQSRAPFLITPPTVRVEANAGQTLRLFYTQSKALPQDRESVFYLNVLDVPPRPKAEDVDGQNYLQFAIRSRLKLFYRPQGLKMTTSQAYDAVTWTKKEGNTVEIGNNSPYYITYNIVQVKNQVSTNVDMLEPFSTLSVEIPNAKVGDTVKWQAITDFGGDANGESTIR